MLLSPVFALFMSPMVVLSHWLVFFLPLLELCVNAALQYSFLKHFLFIMLLCSIFFCLWDRKFRLIIVFFPIRFIFGYDTVVIFSKHFSFIKLLCSRIYVVVV